MTSRSDAELFGFRCDEIYDFLEGHGLKLSRLARSEARSAQVLRVPEWARPYVGRRQISLGDTALILAGISPAHTGHLSDDEYAEFSEWRKALIDAIGPDTDHAAEISATTWGSNQDAEQMLSHADIRAWCARRGHVWPIPDPGPTRPRAKSELAESLEAIEAGFKQWEKEDPRVAELNSAIDAYSGLWKDSKAEAESLRERLAATEVERDEWKARAEQAPGAAAHAGLIAKLENELAVARQEVERLSALVPPHPVRLMEIAVAAQKRHWGDNCDLEDKDTWPSQTGVWQWLESNYPDLSGQQRQAIEIVARPIRPNSSTKF